MPPQDGPDERVYLAALRGLDEARDRYAKASGFMPSFIPLSEALYWIAVLDEGFRAEAGYETARQQHSDGAAVPGLRYVRNFHTHEFVTSLEQAGGLALPISLPASIRSYVRWRQPDDLPQPTRVTRHTAAQQASYAEDVARNDPRVTLRRASDWLHHWHKISRERRSSRGQQGA